ncbi:MAG: beta-galactosidase [Thermoleophilaceae bacterium]|jgi:beta-glucuronidase|nr:beta-galactosidase [Thermoleophilaceae bacterium]
MLRRFAVLAALAVPALAAAAPALAAPPAAQSLDGPSWQFHEDPTNRGLASGWDAGGPTGGWDKVTVPSTFDARPLAKLFSGTVGWYRLRFQAPDTPAGYAWVLRFDQVRRRSVVWLNGRRLGSHDDPYTPFELEARGLRKGMNELVLRVDSRKGTRPREGWWNWGGILRPVTLVPRGRLALNDLALLPRLSCGVSTCKAVVALTGSVRNRTGYRTGGEIEVALTAPDGTRTDAKLPVAALEGADSRVLTGRVPVTGTPALWGPASPQLYDAEVTLRSGGRVEQREHFRIGLRSVTMKDGHLLLNGKPFQMLGAAIQEDFPGHGAALTPEDNDEIVAELKHLGANATRAHYPLNEDLLSKFDAAGILVWNEAPIYHQNRELNRPEGRAAALATVRGTIIATRNHPSVIVNAVANEPVSAPDAYPGSSLWLTTAAQMARRLDPSRPVAVDILTYPNVPYQKTYAAFDVLGINNYFGWYVGKPSHPTGNFLDLEPYLQKMHRRYPKQSLVMTEFGAEATRSGPADEKGTFEFQSDYVNRVMDVVARNNFMDGALYWTVREFAVKPDWLGGLDPSFDPRPDAIHNKALIAYDGMIKPAFDVMKQRIAQILNPPPPAR